MPVLRFIALLLLSLTSAIAQGGAERLRAGDTVDIRVFNHEDLSFKGPIQANGAVEMQFINSVTLAGLTPAEAKVRIENLYSDGWLKRPQVTVNVTEFHKAIFTVGGAVQRPASYPLPRNRPLTILEAIPMAGDFNQRANRTTVILTRNGVARKVDFKAVSRNPRLNITLQDGDVITVKESFL
jgi:protein involved in polysaccharide export with SLBB domain